MAKQSPSQQNWDEAAKKLRGARLWSRFSLAFERLAPAALPLVLVVGLFLIVSWFGLFRSVGDLTRIFIGLVFTLAALASLSALRKFKMPTGDEIDRRLERDNRLLHQPITVQDDPLAIGTDDFAKTLWALHQRKLAGQISDVQGVKARTDIPERDPWALRAVVPLLLVVAFAYSFGVKGGRISDVFFSHNNGEVIAARIDAWVTPPSYTGVAPIFMTSDINAERKEFTAPEGSKIVVRVSGGTGAEQVTFPNVGSVLDVLDDDSSRKSAQARQFEVVAMESGQLSILPQADASPTLGEQVLQQWTLTISDDKAPEVTFDGDVERAVNGAMTLKYIAHDDYRIASGEALVTLLDEQSDDARPLYEAPDIALRLPRRNDEGKAKTSVDLTEHPWAGARVNVQLRVEDDLGQAGHSEMVEAILPGRPFSNKLARALIEQRRILALDANSAVAVYEMLDLFTLYPEETINNTAHFLGITTAKSRLRYANNDDDLRGVVDYLWEVARNIEDGGLSDAEKRLKDAQQALRDALESGASDEEIEQAMNELREAMQEYLQEFARQNQGNPQNQQSQQNTQQLDQQSLDEMLDRLEEMAKSGARDKAMDMLSQLNDMMNNLQMAQPQQGQQGQQNQAQQQMNELGEILRKQQELMNDTFQRSQRPEDGAQEGEQRQGEQPDGQQPGNSQQGQQQPGQGQQSGEEGEQGQQGQQGQQRAQGGAGIEGLEPGQQALQNRLNQFMDGLEGMGINPGEEFSDAERSMGEAGDALGEGSGDQALSDQGEAMDSLRRGAQSMMEQMEQQAQQGQGSSSEPGGQSKAQGRDPLGRPQRSSGPDFGDDVKVPDEIDVRRAREILEAIRKRLGNGALQQLEKDYLERLLDLN
ncbi:TIGR02302 family protein [Ahrensia kielensis]|uniref:TIGR02302 family protein n=1 Tax=Ahrensia kielensis TaxID=76980 RepID=A0ABU9T8W6_9HYPH